MFKPLVLCIFFYLSLYIVTKHQPQLACMGYSLCGFWILTKHQQEVNNRLLDCCSEAKSQSHTGQDASFKIK